MMFQENDKIVNRSKQGRTWEKAKEQFCWKWKLHGQRNWKKVGSTLKKEWFEIKHPTYEVTNHYWRQQFLKQNTKLKIWLLFMSWTSWFIYEITQIEVKVNFFIMSLASKVSNRRPKTTNEIHLCPFLIKCRHLSRNEIMYC